MSRIQPPKNGFLSRLSTGYDRLVAAFAPERAVRRLQARMTMAAADEFFSSGGFDAADRSSREMAEWNPFGTDADSAILGGLDTMRARSRDAERNQPLAGGLINTAVLNTVGVGLAPQARIDRAVLGLSEEQAIAWQKLVDWRWWLWAGSKDCDLARKLTFNGSCRLALRARCVDGESLTLLPYRPLAGLSNPIRLQAVEADRLSNPGLAPDSATMAAGIEKDADGAPVTYHIMRGHPGNVLYADSRRWQWDAYPAFNAHTGLPNVVHYFRTERAGQSRGFPLLAPVLEPLKDLARMGKAELKRAVVSALFTVFIKSVGGGGLANMPAALPGSIAYPGGMRVSTNPGEQSAATTGNMRLGYGAVLGLEPGEEIQVADPKLPNANFDPFFLANVRQIGMRVGIPYEVLIKHYTSSYSAARAAIEDAHRFFLFLRAEMVEDYCDPIRTVWFFQEVAQGTIYAPGFFADPLIRAAWLNCDWIGPSKPVIDPTKEVEAASRRAELGISTLAQETAAMTGGDWEANIEERGREDRRRRAAGLAAAGPSAAANPDLPEGVEAP